MNTTETIPPLAAEIIDLAGRISTLTTEALATVDRVRRMTDEQFGPAFLTSPDASPSAELLCQYVKGTSEVSAVLAELGMALQERTVRLVEIPTGEPLSQST